MVDHPRLGLPSRQLGKLSLEYRTQVSWGSRLLLALARATRTPIVRLRVAHPCVIAKPPYEADMRLQTNP